MQCSVCERDCRRAFCSTCAQGSLWPKRFEMVLRIGEREQAETKAQDALDATGDATKAVVRTNDTRQRLAEITEERERLTTVIQEDRTRLEELRRMCERKRRRLEEMKGLAKKQELVAETIQRETKRLNQKWKALYARTAEARAFLCREAAMLYGLRQKRRKNGRIDYLIGGVTIPNFLKDLNAQHYTHTTTSLGYFSHLLVLVSHYLGLKLPWEVVLPAPDSPFATIRGVFRERHVSTRPLHLSTTLTTLARDESVTHNKFIEGVAMLAHNVAWLCFSQGLEISDADEACAPGHNLWRLLVPRDTGAMANPGFGRASHATANGNLATAPGQVMMSKFKISYKMIADRIRYTLHGDAIVADWDLVPEAERQGGVLPDAPGAGAAVNAGQNAESDKDSVAATAGGSRRGSGGGSANGWTRIKARGGGGGSGGGGGGEGGEETTS